MGYGFYLVGADNRPCGYMVQATCDKRGCDAEIDRGLGYLCGTDPHDWYNGDAGCGFYFCSEHDSYVGPRGGCRHRQRKSWGRVLSDMVPNADGSIVCLDPIGHDGPHAWEGGTDGR